MNVQRCFGLFFFNLKWAGPVSIKQSHNEVMVLYPPPPPHLVIKDKIILKFFFFCNVIFAIIFKDMQGSGFAYVGAWSLFLSVYFGCHANKKAKTETKCGYFYTKCGCASYAKNVVFVIFWLQTVMVGDFLFFSLLMMLDGGMFLL